jgi:signal recognition particle GTPase
MWKKRAVAFWIISLDRENKKNKKSDSKNKSQKSNKTRNQYKDKIQRTDETKREAKENYQSVQKKGKEFIDKTQRELLKTATKEIHRSLERLMKSAVTRLELEMIYKNYFGTSEKSRSNLLSLCGNMAKVAKIIREDSTLFGRLAIDRPKMKKIYDRCIKKVKR